MDTFIDLFVVGLCAIVADRPLDCKTEPAGPVEVGAFDVVALDPGLPHKHAPALWVRLDGLDEKVPDGQCYDDDHKPAPDCSSSPTPEKRWKKYEMQGKELQILQATGGKSYLNVGQRQLGPNCWEGTQPGNPACGQKPDLPKCKADLSWVPEFDKVTGEGAIEPDILANPQHHPEVGAIVRGLVGSLEASPDEGENTWKWDWNYSHCEHLVTVPTYEQKFNDKAVVRGVHSAKTEIWVVDIAGYKRDTIRLKSRNVANAARIELHSTPHLKDVIEMHGKCFIPHYPVYRALSAGSPACVRVPYYDPPCKVSNVGDPICPPTLFNKRP